MTIKAQSTFTPSNLGNATDGLLLQVRGLSIGSSQTWDAISDLSLHVEPRELVILTGGMRAAKSRLLQALAGLRQPDKGEILVDGIDLFANRKLFAPYIGYVPSRMVLQESLTVREVLTYEAQLRLSRRQAKDSLKQRVQVMLDGFQLQPVANHRLSVLSDYQRWLTQIAVEVLTRPGLLLIDTPAAPLEAAEEVHLTGLLKSLASQGTTVIQNSDVPRCAQIADRLLMLTGDGHLAWFGPADEAMAYFQSFVNEDQGLTQPATLDEVLVMLESTGDGTPGDWVQRFRTHPAYTMYVDDPLNDKLPDLLLQDRPLARFRGVSKERTPPSKVPQNAASAKFAALANRTFRQLGRERIGLLMLVAPLLAAGTDFFLSSPEMSDPLLGDPGRLPTALGVLIFGEMLVAALILYNEIAKDRMVYAWERRTLTLSFPYVLSKVWLAVLLAVYQGLVWTLIHFIASGGQGGVTAIPLIWLTLGLVAFIGGLLGLIVSSVTRSAQVAAVLILILILPQFILSGSVLPLMRLSGPAGTISMVNPARYAFETLLTVSGYGQDVIHDACWRLPAAQRDALTPLQKQSCTCLGDNIFSKCRFPGVHKFFSYVIEQPMPLQPTRDTSLGQLPVQPTPQPGQSLEQYAQAVSQYTQALGGQQVQFNNYTSGLQQYIKDVVTWQRTRSEVIGNAEGVIRLAFEEYGQAFQVDPMSHWSILLGMSLFLILVLFGVQQTKGGIL